MNDYKLTLNLPKTNFPMKANLTKREPEILTRWNDDNLYNAVRSAKKGKEIFLLHDGPPYANGNIHLGHSVNKILKDILIKSKGFSGFDSPFIPGWDCHGLPIELEVEKKYGKPNDKFTAENFRLKCREYAAKQVDNQRKDFIRLGILADWSRPYLTMNFKTEANIIRVLREIINNGFLYRDIKPIHWCIDCHSALAESEIEYYNKISLSVDIIFKAVDYRAVKDVFNLNKTTGEISLVAWTTTPWTLPASRAVSLSPSLYYSFVQLEDRALILAKDLVDSVMRRINVKKYTILSTISSKKLEMMRFNHPFLNFDVPVLLDSFVTSESGTGVVHIAGGHGQNDYKVSQKYKIEIVNLVGEDGIYLSKTHPLLDGVCIFDADNIIVDLLQKNNALLHAESMRHSYPFCWRHKTPIIFRATSQWFINVNQKWSKEKILKEIESVQWIPEWSKIRISSMAVDRPDWCVSRQRIWGVPMSLFINKETKKLHPRTLEIMEEVAKRVEIEGIQAWWNFNLQDISVDDANLYEKVSDTLDVWFDSGSTHASTVDRNSELFGRTADIYLEGSDQHRGWFMSSLIISTTMKKEAPYRQVLTHGFVVDAKGKKMSKSIGNVISPQDVINKLGADVLRLWVASNNHANEMAISNEILERTIDKYRRIRNTARFLLANTNDFDPTKNTVKPEEMISLDRLAVDRAKEAQKDIIIEYENYNFHRVLERIMHFCSVEMCSFYFDIIKDRQYTTKANSLARRSCQTALYHILEALVRWIAPIASFTADEIWNYLPGIRKKYIFCEEWYQGLFCLNEFDLISNVIWNELLKVRSEVNWLIEQARIDGKIGSSLEATVIFYAKPDLSKKLAMLGSELRFFFLTSDAKIANYTDVIANAWKSKLIDGLKIVLNKAEGKKCLRCWHYTTDIGRTEKHKNICARCISNIVGEGENRRFV